jgi:monooxygenase
MRTATDDQLSTITVDVLIIGAGISGIGAAVHLAQECPGKSFHILEARPRIGGTWDLFRYPGVRSDSDMYTLGFRFKPWTHPKAIADGPTIKEYLTETVAEYRLLEHIRFEHRVERAEWNSDTARWTITVQTPDGALTYTCGWVFMCGGYYRYDQGYTPEFADRDSFNGPVIHPQHWPEDLNFEGKRVVVIGSGATAVTLVPAMADRGAAHVTMLQRSPTYMVSRPSQDAVATKLRKLLPESVAYRTIRQKNVRLGAFFYKLAKTKPEKVKARFAEGIKAELGNDVDMSKFSPRYNPWDQRVCLVPDGDLFRTMRNNIVDIVNGSIERFTPSGIRLQDGTELAADIIVTATGLNLQMLGGVETIVDGTKVDPGDVVLHKGVMLSGVPNFAMWFGYTNASWTLKADLTSAYMCRMLRFMDATGKRRVMADPHARGNETFVDFSSGYFQRSQHLLPKQGSALPWKLHQNYFADVKLLRKGRIDDVGLEFS